MLRYAKGKGGSKSHLLCHTKIPQIREIILNPAKITTKIYQIFRTKNVYQELIKNRQILQQFTNIFSLDFTFNIMMRVKKTCKSFLEN